MMNSRSAETICAFFYTPAGGGWNAGWLMGMVIKEGQREKGEWWEKRGEGEGKKAEKKQIHPCFIHHLLAWYCCLTMVTKEIKNMCISMWKALGLWLWVQKAKELWFRGIFNLHSDSNKGLAVALRAVVQSDWGFFGAGVGWGATGRITDLICSPSLL